jgi:hypothetical protein
MRTIDVAIMNNINHGCQPVSAVTLDETPCSVAKMGAQADATPIPHVVNEFETWCIAGYAQYKTAIGTRDRLSKIFVFFSLTHARNSQNPKHRTPFSRVASPQS